MRVSLLSPDSWCKSSVDICDVSRGVDISHSDSCSYFDDIVCK